MFGRGSACFLFFSTLLAVPPPVFDTRPGTIPRVEIHASTAAARRREVAERFAPTLYQETLDPLRDFITAFDFDGDWNGANNEQHLGRYPMPAVVYYTVVETATHWFVQYMPYHPVDYKRVRGHPHDTESILMAIRKLGDEAELELMETRFHKVWYQYAARGGGLRDSDGDADDIDGWIHVDEDGRPAVYVQRAGHGMCGGMAPTAMIRELELSCDHRQAPRIDRRGVVYRYTGHAEAPSTNPKDRVQARSYALVEMESSLWAHLRDSRAFAATMDYEGERCATPGWRCPRRIGAIFSTAATEADSAEAPWGQTPGKGAHALGAQFFDPALTLIRRVRFPAPFSLDYEWNPYLGIGPSASSS